LQKFNFFTLQKSQENPTIASRNTTRKKSEKRND
jgi:hypothetical protein